MSFCITEIGEKGVPAEGSREVIVNDGASTSGYGLHPSRGVSPAIVGGGVQGVRGWGGRGRSQGRGGWRGGWRGWRGGRGWGRRRGRGQELTQVDRKREKGEKLMQENHVQSNNKYVYRQAHWSPALAPAAGGEERYFFKMEEQNRKMRMAYFQIRMTGEKLEESRKRQVKGIRN